jgi:preprotein translocase subunit SecG
MIIAVTILHVLVCLFLIVVVLLQSGKAADLAGAFGGMGSQTAFGPRGSATILSKATTISAALFMLTSLSLAILYTREGHVSGSVLDKAPATKQAPAQPATSTPAIPGQSPAPATESRGKGTIDIEPGGERSGPGQGRPGAGSPCQKVAAVV